jgi:hypothetical protein
VRPRYHPTPSDGRWQAFTQRETARFADPDELVAVAAFCRWQSSVIAGRLMPHGHSSRDDVIGFQGAAKPIARQIWRALPKTSAVDPQRSSPFVQFEYSLHSTLMAAFSLSRALCEARDLLVLSVTPVLLQRSDQVALHRMIRAMSQAMRRGIELPVMVGPCVGEAIMSRGVGCVSVTRLMMSGYIR